MKGWVIFIAISLFLVGFVMALSVTTSAVDINNTGSPTSSINAIDNKSPENTATVTATNTEAAREKIKTAIEARNKAIEEALKEKAKEKTTINAEITGTQTKVDIKEIFYTTSTTQDDIITEIIAKFALNKDSANNLLKIEENKEGESGNNNLGVNEANGENNNVGENEQEQLQIKVNINNQFTMVGIKMDFVLNTTNKEEILNAIVDRSKLTADEIKNAMKTEDLKKIIQEKYRVNNKERINVNCPETCTCTGSTIKCTLANGREMTIFAGNSGNVIVQVKGENMSTNVTLYKADGKLYGVFQEQ